MGENPISALYKSRLVHILVFVDVMGRGRSVCGEARIAAPAKLKNVHPGFDGEVGQAVGFLVLFAGDVGENNP